jgi:hypothetical protein
MFIRLAENLSAVSFAQRGRRVTYVIDICFYTSMKLVSHTANEESILSRMMPWNHVDIRLVECVPIGTFVHRDHDQSFSYVLDTSFQGAS